MKKFAILLQRILPPVWLGMILAIAVEAQLKFKAPGITRELGLGVGKLVFTALNRAELIFAVILAITIFTVSSAKTVRFIFGVIALILLTQTLWLIPALMQRADVIISGGNPPETSPHIFYIAFEIIKIVLLLALTILVQRRDVSQSKTA